MTRTTRRKKSKAERQLEKEGRGLSRKYARQRFVKAVKDADKGPQDEWPSTKTIRGEQFKFDTGWYRGAAVQAKLRAQRLRERGFKVRTIINRSRPNVTRAIYTRKK